MPPIKGKVVKKVGTFKVHVSNLPKDVSQADLQLMFEPFGRIVECEVFKKNYAFVHMEEEGCGRAAIKELHNKVIDGMVINVTPSSNNEPPNVQTMKLAVKNVASSVTPQNLRSLFQKFGLVLGCEINLLNAVVTLEATGDIRTAINEMNGFVLESKILEVEPVKVNLKQISGGGRGAARKPRPLLRPPSGRPPQYNQGLVSRNFTIRPSFGGDNYFDGTEGNYEEEQPYFGDFGHGSDFDGHAGPSNFDRRRPGPPLPYQNYDVCYDNQGEQNFGQEHPTSRGGYDEDNYECPDFNEEMGDYFPGYSGGYGPASRDVGPGEAYPPPPKLLRPQPQIPLMAAYPPINNNGTDGRKRGERGGRNRMTTGKRAMVAALNASGYNLPNGYIPCLPKTSQGPRPLLTQSPSSSRQAGPPRFGPTQPRFSGPRGFSNEDEVERSPNYLPVAGFRGFRVPMPREFGRPPRHAIASPMLRPRIPVQSGFRGTMQGSSRPAFRNPSNAPRAIRPQRILSGGSRGPVSLMEVNPMQNHVQVLPQSIMNIDFTADIDFC